MSAPGAARIAVPLHGRVVEVPVAALVVELGRQGPVGSLALVAALARCAAGACADLLDPIAARARLVASLEGAHSGTVTMTTLLALVQLDEPSTAPALAAAALRLPAPLSIFAHVAHEIVTGSFAELARAIAVDDTLAQRAPLVLAAMSRAPVGQGLVVRAFLDALDRLQPVLGATAYRAFLGDVAEAVFRAAQRGADLDALLGDGRGALVDRLCAELPGTPDLVAARGMTWLLGALAAGEDAPRSAIERARARFRDPDFHRDCAAMLGELPVGWPPAPAPR